MNIQFEYFDFIPRKDFKEKADQILNEIRSDIPFECECEARCTYFANKFFFQIIFRNDENLFSAQSILDPKKEDIKVRDWQIKAISNMSTILRNQISKQRPSESHLKIAS